MGRIIINQVKGMNWTAKISLVLIFALLFSTFMYHGWYKPKKAEAAAVTYELWFDATAPSVGIDGNIDIIAAAGTTYNYTLAGGANQHRAPLTSGVTLHANTEQNRIRSTTAWAGTTEPVRAYTPARTAANNRTAASATARVDMYMNAAGTATGTVTLQLYEYDGTTATLKGTATGTYNETITSLQTLNLTFNNVQFDVAVGNRLEVRYNFTTGSSSRPAFLYASNPGTSIGHCNVTFTESAAADTTPPTVNTFTATTPSTSLNIPITAFTASDNVAVTGYAITTSSTPPAAVNPPSGVWTASAPTTYTVASDGTYTLYPWAEDAAGNVSAVFGTPQTVVVDTTPPTVTSTVPSNGATGIVLNSAVTINWSESVDCTSVTTSTVTISPAVTWAKTSCSGSQAVFTPSGQANSTTYTVTVGTGVKDANGNNMASSYLFSYTTAAPPATTTVGDGAAPGNASICPGGAATYLDYFTLTSSGTDTVSAVQVSFAAGTSAGIELVEITNDGGGTVYGSFTNPADTQNITLTTNITANTTQTQYKVRITPKTHANMPVPPGASYAVTGTVTDITCSNTKSLNDSGSATVTIDNLSPNAASWGTNTAGDGQITLNWTYDGGGSNVMIVRYTANTDTTMPFEGTTYSVGSAFGVGGTVRYVGSLTNPQNWVDNVGITNGTTYYYRIFEYDGCINYASSALWSAGLTPASAKTTPGLVTEATHTCNSITPSAPYTGDGNSNLTIKVEYKLSSTPSSSWTLWGTSGLHPPSPYEPTITGLISPNNYDVQVTYQDPDGFSGGSPSQTISTIALSSCAVNTTTIGTLTAAVESCNQVKLIATFTGDDNGNGYTVFKYKTGANPFAQWGANFYGPSPRVVTITGLTANTLYDFQAIFSDLDGVSGTNPTANATTLASCGADSTPPTVSIISPATGSVVGGTVRILVQAYDATGLVGPVNVVINGTSNAATLNTNYPYDVGSKYGVYSYNWNTSVVANGTYVVSATATDAANTGRARDISLKVNNDGGKALGDGNLLVRERGSQLCIDCHALQTHSSQYSTTAYGNWVNNCLDCHTAHETKNIYLVREKIPTPTAGLKDVTFYNTNSFTNSASPYDGICQVCHTQTAYYKNDGTGSSHDTGNCASCHVHQSGFKKLFCNDCHQAPPGNGKHGLHYNTLTLPTSYSNVTASTSTDAYIYQCAKCHTGTHRNDSTHDGSSGDDTHAKRVEVIFDITQNPSNSGGTYTDGGTYYYDNSNLSGKYYRWSNGTCGNLYCHSNATPLQSWSNRTGYLIVYQNRTWDPAVTLDCTGCHKGADTYTNMQYGAGNYGALSDAHWKHAASDRYDLGCKRCHSATVSANNIVSDKSKHVNGVKNWQFDNNGTFDNTAGSYNASYQCQNIYCHSNGQSITPPFSSPTSAAWNTASVPLSCASCHYGDDSNAPNNMQTGTHASHIYNATVLGTNYYCSQCHYDTVNAAANTIKSYTLHVNGAKNVAFNTALNPSATWSSPNCTSVYCHSTGQAAAVLTYKNVTWGGAVLDCKGCHGTEAGSLYGEPRYTNGGAGAATANNHDKHVTSGNANCGKCHFDTATNTGTMKASTTKHTDGSRDVAPDTAGGISLTYTQVSKNCSSISCHGSANAQWGATLACNNCHNAPPSPGNDRHATHYNSATLPTSYSDVTASTSTTVYIYQCAKCHSGTHVNDTHAGTPADPKVVEVLFDTTVDPKNATSGTYTAGGTGYTDGGYKYTNGTCTNVYCHSNATPLTPAARTGHLIEYKSPKWTDAATSPNCTVCHQGALAYASMVYNAVTNPSALSDAHWQHAATDRYNLGCIKCHNATVSSNTAVKDDSKHVNGAKEVVFDTTGTWVSPNCSTNVYCHSTGEASPTYQTVAWNTAGPLSCASCHYGDASNFPNNMQTGKHAAHIYNATVLGTNYYCNQCHYNTTSAGANTIASYTYHVNSARDVAFDTTGGKTNGATPWSSPNCQNIYCHSSGQATPTYRAAISWTGVTTLNCLGCHGTEVGAKWGEPAYANAGPAPNNAANSHAKHVGPAASSGVANCNYCHYSTVDNTTPAIKSSATTHTDGTRQVAQLGGSVTFTYSNDTNKTCTTATCHNNNAVAIKWGENAAASLPTCLGCHGVTTYDSNDLGANFWKNGTPAKINTNEWTTTGHGRLSTSGTYPSTNNPAANLTIAGGDADGSSRCLYCHTTGVGHYDDTNPFRLVNTGGADGQNGVCLICHKTGSAGYDPGQGSINGTIKVTDGVTGSGAHRGTKHDVNTKGGRFCWDCHDPHGDGPTYATGTAAFTGGSTSVTGTGTTWTAAFLNGYIYNNANGVWYQITAVGGATTLTITPAAAAAASGAYTIVYSPTYSGGTGAAFTSGSATVTGTGTNWTSSYVGRYIKNNGNNVWYQISAVGSATSITLTSNAAATASGAYTIQSGNMAMIGRQVMKTQDGTYGYLGASGTAVSVQLYDVNTAGQAIGRLTEATLSPRQGICQACHDSSEVQSTNMTKYWRSDGTDLGPVTSAHNAGTICTQCHKHNAEFKGSGACMDCHTSPITKTLGVGDNGASTIRQIVGSGSYTTGTAAFAAGSTTVTGTTTVWTANHVGWYIKNNANGVWYQVTGWTSATSITISPPAAATVAASAYTMNSGDFTYSNSGHLVNGNVATPYDGTSAADSTTFPGSRGASIVTNWDCIVCHAEGDTTSSGTNIGTTSEHNDGTTQTGGRIALRNVDTPGNPGADGTNFWNINNVIWTTADFDKLDKFCVSCHDSDGANGITVNATNDGLSVGAPQARKLTPFNTSDNFRNAFDKFVRTGVTDVKTAMNRYNYSVHSMSVNSDPTSTAYTKSVTYNVKAVPVQNVGTNGSTTMTTLASLTNVTTGSSNLNRAFAENTGPPNTTTTYTVSESAAATLTNQEFFRAYTPKYPMATTIAANATAYADFKMMATATGTVTAIANLYEYNDTTGIVGAVHGTGASFAGVTSNTNRQTMNNVSFGNAAWTVTAGNRLMVIFSFTTSASSQPAYLWSQTSGTTSGYQKFTVSESTNTTFGARYTGTSTWPATTWTGIQLRDGTFMNAARETATLHCSDCHLSSLNAHGARGSWYLLDNSGNAATATVTSLTYGKNLTENAGGYVFYLTNFNVTAASAVTPPGGYTERFDQLYTTYNLSAASKTIAANGTENPTVTLGTTAQYASLAVVSLNQAVAGGVADLNQWSGTAVYDGTANPSTAVSFAVGAGTNRLLVVAVKYEISAVSAPAITVTYGGTSPNKTLTPIVNEVNTRQGIWVGYLNEADIASANGTNIVSTITLANGVTLTRQTIHAAAYQNVNQTTPVADYSSSSSIAGGPYATRGVDVGPVWDDAGGATGTTNYVCLKCHAKAVYNYVGSTSSQGRHNEDGEGSVTANSIFGFYCLNCHGGGGANNTAPINSALGNIHGVNITYQGAADTVSHTSHRFFPGGFMTFSPINNDWSASGAGTCYFQSGVSGSTWSACGRARSDDGSATQNYVRGTNY